MSESIRQKIKQAVKVAAKKEAAKTVIGSKEGNEKAGKKILDRLKVTPIRDEIKAKEKGKTNVPFTATLAPKHKPITFDLKQLGKDCIAKRERDNISMRMVQMKCGIGPTQLYNIEAGLNTPNADTLAKVIDWLGEPVQKYFVRK